MNDNPQSDHAPDEADKGRDAGKASSRRSRRRSRSRRSDDRIGKEDKKQPGAADSSTASARNKKRRSQEADSAERNSAAARKGRRTADNLVLSVVIPLLDEEESLPELVRQLDEVLEDSAVGSYEILFIDDGSTDNSYTVLRELRRTNKRIRAVRFRRNYGKSAALSVGFERARGRFVVTMDADLQDDPKEIPGLLALLDEGFDLVSGWKKKRHDPWHKTIPSRFFNFVTSLASGIRLHDFNCGLKAYRREVVKSMQVYGEMHRYLPAIAHWQGFRVTEMVVRHHPRQYGVSKFGLSRFVKGYLDLLTVQVTTRFLKRPLHLFGTVGTILGLTGFIIEVVLSFQKIFSNIYLSDRPLMFFGMLLIIVGVQLVSIGLLGEMMVKNSISNRQYSIREEM